MIRTTGNNQLVKLNLLSNSENALGVILKRSILSVLSDCKKGFINIILRINQLSRMCISNKGPRSNVKYNRI